MPQVFEQSLFLFIVGRTVVADALLVLLLPLQMQMHNSGDQFFPPPNACWWSMPPPTSLITIWKTAFLSYLPHHTVLTTLLVAVSIFCPIFPCNFAFLPDASFVVVVAAAAAAATGVVLIWQNLLFLRSLQDVESTISRIWQCTFPSFHPVWQPRLRRDHLRRRRAPGPGRLLLRGHQHQGLLLRRLGRVRAAGAGQYTGGTKCSQNCSRGFKTNFASFLNVFGQFIFFWPEMAFFDVISSQPSLARATIFDWSSIPHCSSRKNQTSTKLYGFRGSIFVPKLANFRFPRLFGSPCSGQTLAVHTDSCVWKGGRARKICN